MTETQAPGRDVSPTEGMGASVVLVIRSRWAQPGDTKWNRVLGAAGPAHTGREEAGGRPWGHALGGGAAVLSERRAHPELTGVGHGPEASVSD